MEVTKVAAAVIWKDGLILVTQRPPGKPRAGLWEFPGGKMEHGETIEQTLIREVKEELGLDCRELLPWQVIRHQYPDMMVELHFIHVLEFSGTPTPHDGQDLRWVSKAEALKLPFLPADAAILAALPAAKPALRGCSLL